MFLLRFFLLLFFFAFLLANNSARAQWQHINATAGASVTCFASLGDTIFAGTNNGVIYSIDDGVTWNSLSSVLTSRQTTGMFSYNGSLFVGREGSDANLNNLYLWNSQLHRLELVINCTYSTINSFDTLGPFLYFSGGDYLSISFDVGGTWQIIEQPLQTNTLICLSSVSTQLFAGSSNGLFYSLDFGATWQQEINSALNGMFITCLTSIGNTLLAGSIENGTYLSYPLGIFRSTDYGVSWKLVNPDSNIYVRSFCSDSSSVYAATENGVLRSTDSGKSWTSVNSGLTSLNIQAVFSYPGILLAGTNGDGIFRTSDVPQGSNPIALSIQELKCFPNPVSSATTITLSTSKNNYADISIVNILGVEVASLYSGELQSGIYSFGWNTSNLPNGVYECIVRMNGNDQTLPILISR